MANGLVPYRTRIELIQALAVVRTICLEGWRYGCLIGSELMMKDVWLGEEVRGGIVRFKVCL